MQSTFTGTPTKSHRSSPSPPEHSNVSALDTNTTTTRSSFRHRHPNPHQQSSHHHHPKSQPRHPGHLQRQTHRESKHSQHQSIPCLDPCVRVQFILFHHYNPIIESVSTGRHGRPKNHHTHTITIKFTDLHCCHPRESVFHSTSFPGFTIDRKGASPIPRTRRNPLCRLTSFPFCRYALLR
ncbi:putative formin-like protein 6 isoform X2 [Iris pallida]|uniref:Formin-like protein 6 isoform X2 n=1 Tax=Iris pallida TaxID=29817 RepID=A0AAX6H784_IRIPA|nr:putative formin-like protein 6 isoform X2 [Iris pallida]